MIETFVLCFFLTPSEFNCDWTIYYIDDHDFFLYALSDYNIDNYTVGLAIYHTKTIVISKQFENSTDWDGNDVLRHEFKHAYLYERWKANGAVGNCPCHFHP